MWLVAIEAVAEASDWMTDLLLGRGAEGRRPSSPAVDRVEDRAEELLAELRRKRNTLARDARRVFQLLGRIPVVLNWEGRLKPDLSELVLVAVHEAEQFGDRQGEKKRRYAIELIVRVVENYNVGAIPFLPSVEKALVAPLVGIVIDWSVKILNIHGIWPPVTRVTFPRIFQGSYGGFFRIAFWVAGVVLRLRKWLLLPTKYERRIRRSLRAMAPQIERLLRDLPPDRLHGVLEELANVVAELGQATAPYVQLIDQVLRLGSEFVDLTLAERSEVAFRILRGLLLEAYAGDEFALLFIDSPLGDQLLWAIVEHTSWVLARNGLLPDAGS